MNNTANKEAQKLFKQLFASAGEFIAKFEGAPHTSDLFEEMMDIALDARQKLGSSEMVAVVKAAHDAACTLYNGKFENEYC